MSLDLHKPSTPSSDWFVRIERISARRALLDLAEELRGTDSEIRDGFANISIGFYGSEEGIAQELKRLPSLHAIHRCAHCRKWYSVTMAIFCPYCEGLNERYDRAKRKSVYSEIGPRT